MCPFPRHLGGTDAAAELPRTLSWKKLLDLVMWLLPAYLHGALPRPTPPSPAQMLSMEMKQSSFQGPSCFQ